MQKAGFKEIKIYEDPYLVKIINRFLITDNVNSCMNTLIYWKNLSCIVYAYDPEATVSNYRNPDGSNAVKVVQPSIITLLSGFYWFAKAFPFTKKFLQTMRRDKEANRQKFI